PVSSSSPFFSRGVVSFDLHTEIVGGEWVGRKARVFRLDPVALWREAIPREPGDTTTLVLSPVHLRLQLAVHALKHSYSRLIWLVDLALVLRDAPWPALLEQARAAGALRPLAYAVASVDWLLPGRLDVSEAVRRELPALGRVERGFMRLVARRPGVETAGELVVSLSIPGLIGKAAYLAELGIPQRHVLARHYPATPSWLLYPRRVVRLASLGLQEVAKLCYRRGGGSAVMRWLVDGYNVIRRDPELRAREAESLEAGRRALLHLLARARGTREDGFTVVFDGARRAGGAPTAGGRIRVLFSRPPSTADDELMRQAREVGNGAGLGSSDREGEGPPPPAGGGRLAGGAILAALAAPGNAS